MTSVRNRIEAEQYRQQEPAAPMRPRSPLTVATATPSTRERTEAKQFEATPEHLTPLDKNRATGLTSSHSSFSQTSVRGRLDQQLAANNEQPTRSANSQYWMDVYEEEQRKIAERDAEREREMEQRVARDRAIEKSNARALIVNLAFDQFNATPYERKRILALPAAKDASPETLVSMLLEVRSLHEFSESCSAEESQGRN